MKIGDSSTVLYSGMMGDNHMFSVVNSSDQIQVPDGKLFGKSVLGSYAQYKLTKRSYSQYVVSAS